MGVIAAALMPDLPGLSAFAAALPGLDPDSATFRVTLTGKDTVDDEVLGRASDGRVAIVFGPEKTGLHNDDMDLCAALVAIPTTAFSSLNLAMAVQVIAYELFVATEPEPPAQDAESPPATAGEMEHLYAHVERLALASGFLNPDNPRYLMRRLRRLFGRAEPDRNEVNILRGIFAALESPRWRGGDG